MPVHMKVCNEIDAKQEPLKEISRNKGYGRQRPQRSSKVSTLRTVELITCV